PGRGCLSRPIPNSGAPDRAPNTRALLLYMPNNSPDPQWRRRDGTSQASRLQAAPAPEYVRVDERSDKDLLAFAREYAKELRYYDADNQPRCDWRAFLDPPLDPPLDP